MEHGAGGPALGDKLKIPQRGRLFHVVKRKYPSRQAIKRLDNKEKEKDKETTNQLK
jgi:hypothetical protein